MRRALTSFFRSLVRLFFRRIEVAGAERVPLDQPVIFAANHPNGLVDPLFILCFAPRRVSFLAKAPLFRYPVIGWFARVFESIPVYRKQDNTAGSNRETFGRAREILRAGGSIAIFPEGTTHSDPQLREFKTGAARIALGSALPSLAIVPAGIYYTAKQTFRSEALVWFGEPMQIAPERCDDEGEPPPDSVIALTRRIEEQLASVTLQADSRAALELVERAERIFSAGAPQPLAEEVELRRRFARGYHALRERDPERLERLASAIRQFDPEDLAPRVRAGQVARMVLILPFAVAGVVIHFIPYRVVDVIAKRLSREGDEMTATVKFITALLLYPLTWLAIALVLGGIEGLIALIVMPLLGYAALRVIETLDEAIGGVRAMLRHTDLSLRRRAIRDEILAVADTINV